VEENGGYGEQHDIGGHSASVFEKHASHGGQQRKGQGQRVETGRPRPSLIMAAWVEDIISKSKARRGRGMTIAEVGEGGAPTRVW